MHSFVAILWDCLTVIIHSGLIAICYMWIKKEKNMVPLAISLDGPAKFITFGFISVSVPNLIMIGLIIVFFILALVIPFPTHKSDGK